MSTGIQWTDETWNPVSGCSKVSQGCKHCYAERVFPRAYSRDRVDMPHADDAERWPVRPRRFTDVVMHHDRLGQPLHWRKPRRVFVNSMSDLFHEDVPDGFIDQVWAVMALSPQHTFQILTKRPERMRAYMARHHAGLMITIQTAAKMFPTHKGCSMEWPLRNVWLGVSVEDQETADERIPLLLQTPAAVRFISAEPLLGPIELQRFMWPVHDSWPCGYKSAAEARAAGAIVNRRRQALVGAHCVFLDWVIVGGESGPKARPCDVGWIRGLVGQCKDAGVPVFVKQLGVRPVKQCTSCFAHPGLCRHYGSSGGEHGDDRLLPFSMIDRKGGDPAEWPAALRVREFPA